MSSLKLHIVLSKDYISQFLKSRLEYKGDMILGVCAAMFFHAVSLIFIDVLFVGKNYNLNGWNEYHVLFIYGFSIFPTNLFFI